MAAASKLVAITSFACELKGVEYVIRQGDVLPSNHPSSRDARSCSSQPPARPNVAAP